MTAVVTQVRRPTPRREVRTRRIPFAFPAADIDRHFADGDLLMSHLIALGSAVFPEGEDFFVRSVRNYRDAITDPELRKQVQGFIGQEAMHGRAHRTFNERLGALGYPARLLDRATKHGLGLAERVLPKPVQLAITAALEHYTATLAEVLLSSPQLQDQLAADEVRALFLWHALEESEHKAVAFDVFQAVSGNDRIRIGVMRAVSIDLLVGTSLALAASLLLDPAARDPRRLRHSWTSLKRSPFARREVLDRLRDYNRRDFHPDDYDHRALIEEWRGRLLGDGGPLAGRVQTAGASRRDGSARLA
jgi:predicted metal-dependent hydrolase